MLLPNSKYVINLSILIAKEVYMVAILNNKSFNFTMENVIHIHTRTGGNANIFWYSELFQQTKKLIIDTISHDYDISNELSNFNNMNIYLVDNFHESYSISSRQSGGYVEPDKVSNGEFNINIVVSLLEPKNKSYQALDQNRNYIAHTVKTIILHEAQHNRDLFKGYFKHGQAKIQERIKSILSFVNSQKGYRTLEQYWINMRTTLRDIVDDIYLEGLAQIYEYLCFWGGRYPPSARRHKKYKQLQYDAVQGATDLESHFNKFIYYLEGKGLKPASGELLVGVHRIGFLMAFEILWRTKITFKQLQEMGPLRFVQVYEKIARQPIFGINRGMVTYNSLLKRWYNATISCPKCREQALIRDKFCPHCKYLVGLTPI